MVFLGPIVKFLELNLMKFINAVPVHGFSEIYLIQMKISVPTESIWNIRNFKSSGLEQHLVWYEQKFSGEKCFEWSLWSSAEQEHQCMLPIWSNDVKHLRNLKIYQMLGQAGMVMAWLKISGLLLKETVLVSQK